MTFETHSPGELQSNRICQLQTAAFSLPAGPRFRLSTCARKAFPMRDLNGHKRLEGILDETVHAGLLPREVADVWFTMANGMYGSDPRLARDEGIRSGSLAAMTLMLAAGNRGYVSCPIGFNPVQVMEILSIRDHYVPVMMLTVGRPASGNNARRPRLPVDQVLAFNISLE